jgi:two-component system nitrogen regulation sensor histidine kinase NtrY
LHRLRNRLVAVFLAATILPLGATIWITTSLLERSLTYASTDELDRLSDSLEGTVRELYRRERDALREDAATRAIPAILHSEPEFSDWPDEVRRFWDSGEAERFSLAGPGGNRLVYLVRDETGVLAYSRSLGDVRMDALTQQLRRARELVDASETRNLERGFTLTWILLMAAVWVAALASLIFLASRVSEPIQQLTAALTDLAAGRPGRRLETGRDDEVGRAVKAFNHMAGQLERSQERLVYLTQVASWQTLARKTAHELKNSLTPIRLTVEEMFARGPDTDREFVEEAGRIVVDEIDTLERRVRAFSEFSSEPSAEAEILDLNGLLEERIALLAPAHPEVSFSTRLDAGRPKTRAGPDQIKGILTNLLQNAAEASGPAGRVLAVTATRGRETVIEIHDSGPGLEEERRRTLFEPTISFKKHGMGLGLSIARRDIMLIDGELEGAAFRIVLPLAGGEPA